MKRPPGLWILLAAGVLWLRLQDVYGIRATALIFGKSSTSTTTTTEAPSGPDAEAAEEVEGSTSASEVSNSTKPALTGNPQIDYVWDPNLPQELNGYNLSDYPFYERVPDETIEFKCDGLHDGFYASVPHKCQVYHHCLFGTRYDFLCANYTAFDQKTFICHFASEVDCVNSKKFWHRNDALYQEASTTTQKPLNLAIYTPPPVAGDPVTPLPATAQGTIARRPAGARRPYRRRPQVDYYEDEYYDDEYYDERPRPRKRLRPKPRPIYEDDEYEYEDERYERPRGGGRRRRPYRRPIRRRNKDRKPDDYEEEVDDRFEDDDFKAGSRRKVNDRRKVIDDYQEDEEDIGEKRRPAQKSSSNKRHPSDDQDDIGKDKKTSTRNRRPVRDEYEDEEPQGDDSRSYERPRKAEKNKNESSRPVIKPVSGSIYDRPRLAPKINLPVPKNAADKFAYKNLGTAKSTTTTTSAPLEDEEYYDEEYEEPATKRPKFSRKQPQATREQSDSKLKNRPREETTDTRKQTSASKNRSRSPDSSTEQTTEKQLRSKYVPINRSKFGRTSTKRPVTTEEYYDDDYEEEENRSLNDRPLKNSKSEKVTTTTATPSTTAATTTTTEASKEKSDPIIRVVKRPFLPSRGGNPFAARGLQPVGTKAEDKNVEEPPLENSESKEKEKQLNQSKEASNIQEEEKPFKPSPIIVKIPVRKVVPTTELKEMFDSEQSRPQPKIRQQNFKEGPRTTQKPQIPENIPERNPLDLNEYDVTLNDALNPTLPNLPVRGFPTGFNAAQDFTYNAYQSRPRYVLADSVVSQTNPEYIYQAKSVRQPQQRYEIPIPNNHRTQYNTLGNFRPEESQSASHTRVLYPNY